MNNSDISNTINNNNNININSDNNNNVIIINEEEETDIINNNNNSNENEAILNSNFKINNSPSPEKITSYISESPSAITEVGRDSNNLNSDNNNYNNVNDEDDFMNLVNDSIIANTNISMRTMTRNSNNNNNNNQNNNNRPQGYRLSAPDPFRPNDELFNHPIKPRPNSQIILPTSMSRYSSVVLPKSDQEFHMLAKILNWPPTSHKRDNNSNQTSSSQNFHKKTLHSSSSPKLKNRFNDSDNDNKPAGNLVSDSEIILEASKFSVTSGDIITNNPSSLSTAAFFILPHDRYSMSKHSEQNEHFTQSQDHYSQNSLKQSLSFILPTLDYGIEIFDQITSDDDPRLIVWSIISSSSRRRNEGDSTFSSSSSSSNKFTIKKKKSNISSISNITPTSTLIKSSSLDQRIVHGLKRVIKRLKKIYYPKPGLDLSRSEKEDNEEGNEDDKEEEYKEGEKEGINDAAGVGAGVGIGTEMIGSTGTIIGTSGSSSNKIVKGKESFSSIGSTGSIEGRSYIYKTTSPSQPYSTPQQPPPLSPSLLFFKKNFKITKLRSTISLEKFRNSSNSSRKKRSMSFSEAFCGYAEDDDEEEDDDKNTVGEKKKINNIGHEHVRDEEIEDDFVTEIGGNDLSQIDHAIGIAGRRRNSSPAYIGGGPTPGNVNIHSGGRSLTGIKMLCATSPDEINDDSSSDSDKVHNPVNSPSGFERGENTGSIGHGSTIDDYLHIDGFSFPKVLNLRSATTLKDLEEEKYTKRVSWSTMSSVGGVEELHNNSGSNNHNVGSSSKSNDNTNNDILPPNISNLKIISQSFKFGSSNRSGGGGDLVTPTTPNIKDDNSNILKTKKSSSTIGTFSIRQSNNNSANSTSINSRSHPHHRHQQQNEQSYKSFILMYRSDAIAKQFCLIECDLLLKVKWEDLIQVGYSNSNDNSNKDNVGGDKKDAKGKRKVAEHQESGMERNEGKQVEDEQQEELTPRQKLSLRQKENGVDKVVERFRLTCDWVATEVILTRSLEDRVKVIEKFIHIAQKCLKLSNFSTLTQILLGLRSPPVERLRRTWSRVRSAELKILKELNEYISPFGNWKVIRDAMHLVFNAAIPSYIDPPTTNTPSSSLPFQLSSSLPPSSPSSSLSSIASSTPSTPLSHLTSQQNQQFPPPLSPKPQQPLKPLVNFHKHRTTATIIKRVLTFQSLAQQATRLVVMDMDLDEYV
ncbi:8847_t:CDS:10 [Entrophospora sp. SA101]|nr:8847_t:CDS:10 [Entrophospora sp. SA101]